MTKLVLNLHHTLLTSEASSANRTEGSTNMTHELYGKQVALCRDVAS